MHTLNTLLRTLTNALKSQYAQEEAQLIAWEFIRHVTHKSRIQLIVEAQEVPNEQAAAAVLLVEKHLHSHMPVAYLIGELLFGDLTLAIRPPILIPRSETESWCYELIERLEPLKDQSLRILDLCTGSGCIALALAHALPHATVIGIDINPEAIALAEENRAKLGITNCSFIKSDLFGAVSGQQFDLIVANPPYIGEDEWESLATSVKSFEDRRALIAEGSGLAIIKKIIAQSPRLLQHNSLMAEYSIPQLLIEIGYQQAEPVNTFLQQHGYATITTWKDYQGHNRVACARVAANVSQTETIT